MTEPILERRRRVRYEEDQKRRMTDVPIEMWSWDDLGKIARNMFEHLQNFGWDTLAESAWPDRATALRDIQIYLAHEVAGWPYDRCQQAEGDASPVQSHAVVGSRFRRHHVKSWIGLDMRTRLLERR